MKTQSVTLTRRQQVYWQAVELCLIRFHHLDPRIAAKTVAGYRADLYSSMSDPRLLYHESPFYMACDIADHDLELAQFRSQYEAIIGEAKSLLAS